MANVNTLNYVDYEFDTLLQQLIDRIKQKDAWKDTYRSSTGEMILEVNAYVGNLFLYMLERRASEQFLPTAQLRSSVINLVRALNYSPKRRVSATGKLTFSINAPSTKKIFIPKYTECQSSTGTKYITTEDVVLMPGQLTVDAQAMQGSIVTLEQTASGALNYELKIESDSVENSHLFVYVSDVQWNKVDSFIFSVNTSQDYREILDIDEQVIIRFGNNIFGAAPASGAVIRIVYAQSDGLAGNVYEVNRVTTINSSLFDEDGAVATLGVTNNDVFIGGDDSESTEEIRSEAPRVFKTGDRLVTREDHVALIDNYPGVATSNAWGEREENPPNYNMFNRVKLVVLLQDWQLPSLTFKQQLSDYMYTKAMMTVKYEYVNPTIIQVIPILTVRVARTGSFSAVQSAIQDALAGQFSLGVTTNLGSPKRLADLIAIVEAVDNVAYHYMTLDIRRTLATPFDSSFTYGAYLELTPVKAGSIRVYAGAELIGIDNGTGSIASVGSAYTVTGAVTYASGYLGVDITPTPPSGDEIYVRYQQDQSGDIVPAANQIAKLYQVEIPSIAYA